VPNANGWNNGPVTVNYTVSDSLSGVDEAKSSYAADVITQEGAGISVGAEAAQITEAFPPAMPLYDPGTGKWITQSPWAFAIALAANQTETIRYYAP
jgi:hypothetical protein